jgi:hypothetical protein
VSADLLKRLLAWQGWYNHFEWPEGFSEAPPGFDIDSFSAEGLAIAKAVKTELPDWTIIYHDEAKCFRGPHLLDRPRAEFGHEIP